MVNGKVHLLQEGHMHMHIYMVLTMLVGKLQLLWQDANLHLIYGMAAI